MARTPIHPGEHLAEELKELGISAAELARQIEVPVNRVTSIINGQRGITADTALRLGHWFGTSPEFWLNLQKLYELRLARDEVGDRVRRGLSEPQQKGAQAARKQPEHGDRMARQADECGASVRLVQHAHGDRPARLDGDAPDNQAPDPLDHAAHVVGLASRDAAS